MLNITRRAFVAGGAVFAATSAFILSAKKTVDAFERVRVSGAPTLRYTDGQTYTFRAAHELYAGDAVYIGADGYLHLAPRPEQSND